MRWSHPHQLYTGISWLGARGCMFDVAQGASAMSRWRSTLYCRQWTYLWSTPLSFRVLSQMGWTAWDVILLDLDLAFCARFVSLPLSLLLAGQRIVLGSLAVTDIPVEHSCSLLCRWRTPCKGSWYQLTTNQSRCSDRSSRSETAGSRPALSLLVVEYIPLPAPSTGLWRYTWLRRHWTVISARLYSSASHPLNIIMLLWRTVRC